MIAASDLFDVEGHQQLQKTSPAGPYAQRVVSLLHLIDVPGAEEAVFTGRIFEQLREHDGYRASQALPGVGPILAAIFVAEIGDATRFSDPERLCSWAGLTPQHHESFRVSPGAGSNAMTDLVGTGGKSNAQSPGSPATVD